MSTNFNWTPSKTRSLIAFYHDNDMLHNFDHADYKKMSLKNAKLQSISKYLGCSVKDAKVKWAKLRTHFIRETKWVKEGKPNGSGVEEAYVPKWQFFEYLQFLHSNAKLRNTHSSSDETLKTFDDSNEANGSVDKVTKKVCYEENADFDEIHQSYGGLSMTVSDEETAKESSCPNDKSAYPKSKESTYYRKLSKKGKKKDLSSSEPSPIRTPVAKPTILNTTSEADADDIFGILVAKQLKNVDEVRRDILKVKILDLIVATTHNIQITSQTYT